MPAKEKTTSPDSIDYGRSTFSTLGNIGVGGGATVGASVAAQKGIMSYAKKHLTSISDNPNVSRDVADILGKAGFTQSSQPNPFNEDFKKFYNPTTKETINVHTNVPMDNSTALNAKLQRKFTAPYVVARPRSIKDFIKRLNPFNKSKKSNSTIMSNATKLRTAFKDQPLLDKKQFGDKALMIGSGAGFNSTGTIAHEMGHALQSKRLMSAAARATPYLRGSALLPAIDAAMRDDSDGGAGAILGTAMHLPVVAAEVDASYRGSKLLGGSLKNRLTAFRGVPTYLMAAATPALTYGAIKAGKPLVNKAINKLYDNQRENRNKRLAKQAAEQLDTIGTTGAIAGSLAGLSATAKPFVDMQLDQVATQLQMAKDQAKAKPGSYYYTPELKAAGRKKYKAFVNTYRNLKASSNLLKRLQYSGAGIAGLSLGKIVWDKAHETANKRVLNKTAGFFPWEQEYSKAGDNLGTASILATLPVSYSLGKQVHAIDAERKGLSNARMLAADAKKMVKDAPPDLFAPRELEVYTNRRKKYVNEALKSRQKIKDLKRGLLPRVAALGLLAGGALGSSYLTHKAQKELERTSKTAGILDSLSKAKYRYNTASTSKATAIKNYHENLFNEDMLKDMIRQYRQRHSTIYNPNTRYGQRAKLYGEIISADEGPKLRKQVNRLATELRFTRGQQPQLKELAEKVDSPLYVAKKTLNI